MNTIHGLDLAKTQEYLNSERGKKKYLLGAVFGLPLSSTLPVEFSFTPLGIKNQKYTQMCLSHAISSASELQEGIPLEATYTNMKTHQIMGNVEDNGADAESGAKAAKQGFLPASESPFSLENHDASFLTNPLNWPVGYDSAASKYAKDAFFWIEPDRTHDFFDAIRASIQLFKNENRSVVIGLPWCYEWTQDKAVINESGTQSGGHALNVVGWTRINGQDYLKIQNSYGQEWGDKGYNYISRKVMNKLCVFALMFKDKPDNLTHDDVIELSLYYRLNMFLKLLVDAFPFLKTYVLKK